MDGKQDDVAWKPMARDQAQRLGRGVSATTTAGIDRTATLIVAVTGEVNRGAARARAHPSTLRHHVIQGNVGEPVAQVVSEMANHCSRNASHPKLTTEVAVRRSEGLLFAGQVLSSVEE
jgi:hypothetical protein